MENQTNRKLKLTSFAVSGKTSSASKSGSARTQSVIETI